MTLFSNFERIGQPLATRRAFFRRLGRNLGLAGLLIGGSLVVGMCGYRFLEGLGWLDSYAHAAMILSGMGPYNEPNAPGARLFEGTYALYSGLVVVATTGLVLAPIFHRILHGLHVPDDGDGSGDSGGRRASRKSSGTG